MATPRRPLDAYMTPRPCIRAFLPALDPYLRAGMVLEPSCGDGSFLAEILHRVPTATVVGLDIDPKQIALARVNARGATVAVRNFLTFDAMRELGVRPALIVGNPPYNLAPEFLEHSLAQVSPIGAVAFLLRLGFLEADERADLICAHTPDVHGLCQRPSFTGDGKTDGTAYGFLVWPASRKPGEPGLLRMIDWKPSDKRLAARGAA
jgi:SAM-dependent methyltransferase